MQKDFARLINNPLAFPNGIRVSLDLPVIQIHNPVAWNAGPRIDACLSPIAPDGGIGHFDDEANVRPAWMPAAVISWLSADDRHIGLRLTIRRDDYVLNARKPPGRKQPIQQVNNQINGAIVRRIL